MHYHWILPATDTWCVIIYPKSGGLLKKKHEIKASCTFTSHGQYRALNPGSVIFHDSIYAKMERAKTSKAVNDEMRKVAWDVHPG